MRKHLTRLLPLVLLALPAAVFGQALPTSQPNFLRIIREEVKPGRVADHAKIEAGWPAAFEKANYPDYYIALESMTGTNEAWFLIPSASHAAEAEMMKREAGDPVLAAELERLSRADGEVLSNIRTLILRARKDLSYGAFPDVGKIRFYEISFFRVRPGGEEAFAAAAKAWGAAAARAGQSVSYRVNEVLAGMPGPTYVIFSSVTSFADFDKTLAADEAIMKSFTPEDGKVFQKFTESAVNMETHRFRVSPTMSYVPKDVRAQDPAFWNPKK